MSSASARAIDLNHVLSRLREKVHAPPNLRNWLEICALAQRIGPVGIDYASQHLSDWPTPWNTVPSHGASLRDAQLQKADLRRLDLTGGFLTRAERGSNGHVRG
ncbi:MAG: hypothetical protein AAFX99_05310 [Myxococcota bacterium]